MDPFYRIIYDDGSQFDYVGDEERLLANIAELSPQDVDGYKKLARHAEDIFDIGYTNLGRSTFSLGWIHAQGSSGYDSLAKLPQCLFAGGKIHKK